MKNTIQIIATSDVHGYIYPYSYADSSEKNHGFARIQTLISSLRNENTIVIDNGDTLQGSPLTFYHDLKRKGEENPVTIAMREIGYDMVNVGNHDFSYGQDALFQHLASVHAPCITANFLYQGEVYDKSYHIMERCGKKLAFIGVTTQHIPNWEDAEKVKDMEFLDAFETLKTCVKEVKEKEKPDYIIGVYHGGFERNVESGEWSEEDTKENEGYRMLEEIEDLDILITGHQHRSLCGKKNGIAYTQTLLNGQEIAVIEIDVERGECEPRILKVDAPADEEMMKLLKQEEDDCQKWLDQPLGSTEVNLKIEDEFKARLDKSQVITFLNLVEKEATGADLASTALFTGATGFDREITMRNLVSTYVYANTLVVKRVTGKILKEYLEKNAQYWSSLEGKIIVDPSYDEPTPMHFNYDMLDGITYTIQVSKPIGERIVSMQKDEKEIQMDDVFTLVVSNYRASGAGGFGMIKDAETVSVNLNDMVDLIAEYIMKQKVIRFEEVHNINVIL